jgi:hypothetical protein
MHRDIGQTELRDHVLHRLDLFCNRIHQGEAHIRPHDREGNARHAAARTEIQHRALDRHIRHRQHRKECRM